MIGMRIEESEVGNWGYFLFPQTKRETSRFASHEEAERILLEAEKAGLINQEMFLWAWVGTYLALPRDDASAGYEACILALMETQKALLRVGNRLFAPDYQV